MPELPEVETYVRDLDRVLPGRTLHGARVGWPNQLPRNAADELDTRVRGQSIRSVTRRGKYIVIDLDTDWLLIHLKMSGRLQIAEKDEEPNPYAHVVFALDGGAELRFHDPRKFGRVYLVDALDEVVGHLGPEPLDASFSLRLFAERIAGRRGRLKPLLLNQTFVAGLGNIYVDEALWQAELHPLRTADGLSEDEIAQLHAAIVAVLTKAVRLRGTSFSQAGYRDLTGNTGEMQGTLNVFRRTGEPCPRCSAPIERSVVAMRGTHTCPRCQRPS